VALASLGNVIIGNSGYISMNISLISQIKEYLKLMRIQAAGAVWIVLILGALAQGGMAVTWEHIGRLFPVALFTYILAIVMNEFYDVEVDRVSKELATKPLVSGTISKRTAYLIFMISGLIAALLVYWWWALAALVWFLASTVVGAQYNIYGKKKYWMDIFVALWAAMYCMLGAMTVFNTYPWKLESLVYIISVMWFFRLVVGNSVEGGLKDLEHDLKAKAKTLPRWFGVKLRKGRIIYTPEWWVFEVGLELGFLTAISLPYALGFIDYTAVQLALIIIFMVGMFVTLRHISPRSFDREDIKKHTFLHEALGFGIMGIMLLDVAGWQRALIILVVPIGWFALWTKIIYGQRLPTI
jgi:4-hydroxybenzoate polyprenyltransferase